MFQVNHTLKPKCDPHRMIGSLQYHSIFDRFCALVIICLQFGKTAMFMWMLCEGIHLNNILTVSVFKNHLKTCYFHLLGWCKFIETFFLPNRRTNDNRFRFFDLFVRSTGVPFGLTFSWSIVMAWKEPYRR